VVTVIALVPIAVIVVLALRPGTGSPSHAIITLNNLRGVLGDSRTLRWLANSLGVTLASVVVSVVVSAPAGYVLSRGRGRTVSGYSLLLFVVQSFPVITSVIPLFILFVKLHLVDSLVGLAIIYVGASMAVATWMMAAYMDSIPVTLEQAAWIDGASVFGGFLRIVLRNCLPGVLSTAIFTFLIAWNDYLVAVVFIRAESRYTLPIGVQALAGDWPPAMALALVTMAPPVIVFALLHRFFTVGGIGGALAES
jgi:multiple sugar transport system permease protein